MNTTPSEIMPRAYPLYLRKVVADAVAVFREAESSEDEELHLQASKRVRRLLKLC